MNYRECDIISNEVLYTVFQPIISLKNGEVLGYEALSRTSKKCEFDNIGEVFSFAEKNGFLWQLEQICRKKALKSVYEKKIDFYNKKLFLNVNPNIIYDEKFKKGFTKKIIESYNMEEKDIVFEITERNVIEDMEGFQNTIVNYKSQGYKIAIDDTGAGYSGLNLISEVCPDYIKLDMYLIRNIDKNRIKYAIIKGMSEFSKESRIPIIAEGIETYEELEKLIELGVEYGQGYYIQRPNCIIKEIDEKVIRDISSINQSLLTIF